MPKSKKAPALFEVIGNSTYDADSDMPKLISGIGRSNQRAGGVSPPLPTKTKPKATAIKPPARTATVLKSTTESPVRAAIRRFTAKPDTLFQIEKGRVFFSLNMTNACIAIGVVALVVFAAFLFGSRLGPEDGQGQVASAADGGQMKAEVAPNVFANPRPKADHKGVPLASVPNKTGSPGKDKGKTVRFASRGVSNAAATVQNGPSGVQTGSVGVVETTEPRTPGLTYIVIESFFQKEGHDGLQHARHAQAFLAAKGIPSYIIPKKDGKTGWQLISRKGFNYRAQKRACLDYKQKIREFAKSYKPLPGGYGLFQGFPEKFIPSK